MQVELAVVILTIREMSNIIRVITFDNLLREKLTRLDIPLFPYYFMNGGSGWHDSGYTLETGEFNILGSNYSQEGLI